MTEARVDALEYDLSIVGIVGLPAAYGGFETLAEELVTRLAPKYRIEVFCTANGRARRQATFKGADLKYVGLHANGWQSIPYDVLSMLRTARRTRAMLVLGVSGCLFLPFIRLLAPRVRVITNVDGVEWRRRKWGFLARWFLRLSERTAVRHSDIVIADNEGIRDYLREAYSRNADLIAYGGDCAEHEAPAPRNVSRFEAGTYHLTVCRIEPENNVDEILEAFTRALGQRIVVVGDWSASKYSRRLFERYAGHPNIELKEPIYDRATLRALRGDARAYVHGHSAGGTNPSLVESMTVGMAVLAYDVPYNRNTTGDLAAYWRDAADLARLMESLPDRQLAANARAMADFARSHYTWGKVTAQYESVLFPRKERDLAPRA